MSVAGDFAAAVEVVKDAELPCQCVLVRCDVLAIHDQRRVAVAWLEVSKDLIVRTVLFNDVNHVADGIRSGAEGDTGGLRFHQVALSDFRGQLRQVLFHLAQTNSRNRPADQRCDIGMFLVRANGGRGFWAVVRTCATSFARNNEQVVAFERQSRGVPFRGNEAQGLAAGIDGLAANVKNSDRVGRSVSYKKPPGVGAQRQRVGVAPAILLSRQ